MKKVLPDFLIYEMINKSKNSSLKSSGLKSKFRYENVDQSDNSGTRGNMRIRIGSRDEKYSAN